MTMNIQKKMRSLEKEIQKHQDLYYKKNRSEMSDYDFDSLLKKLQKLEIEYPRYKSENSPTHIIGSDIDNAFQKRKHIFPVLSLSNTYTRQELMAWAKKITTTQKKYFHVQWKIDGATLVLHYKNGQLEHALTRGTGLVGDDVTNNALTIRDIPKIIKGKSHNIVVRGEVYMTYQDFSDFNDTFNLIYANPRNLSAGSLKQKKSSETAKRPLRWMAFNGSFLDNETNSIKYKRDEEILKAMEKMGLPMTVGRAHVPLNLLEKTVHGFEKEKNNLDFPVDGLVIKLDDLADRKKLGYTSNSPRWAVAYKFTPETAISTVISIDCSVGRTGRITPRVEIEPVSLSGSTVRYATLHNADFIKKLDIRIGSKVKLTKRGDIIPAIEEVLDTAKEKKRKELYYFPEKCPSCSTKLVRTPEFIEWLCPNPSCPAQMLKRIIFFCARKQMDISNMGEGICQTLFQKGLLLCIPDIYRLENHQEKLEKIPSFGKRSVEKVLAGITVSRRKEFQTLLLSLGLEEIGPNIAGLLIEAGYNSYIKLKQLVSLNPKMSHPKISYHGNTSVENKEKNLHALFCEFIREQEGLIKIKGIGRVRTQKILENIEENIEKLKLQKEEKEKEILEKAGYHQKRLQEIREKKLPIKLFLHWQKTLTQIKGIDLPTASTILRQMSDPKIQKLFEELGELGLSLEEKVKMANEKNDIHIAIFKNQIWCVTGSFLQFKPRDLAMTLIKKYGGKVSHNITSQTTHLLTGSGAGSKLEKAQKNKIKIVTEKEFLSMI